VRHDIDYLGAAVLAAGLSSVVLAASLGGTSYPWGSLQILVLIVVGVVLLALFPLVERRAAEPILPLELFRNRVFAVTSAVGFIVGLALFGAITYLPLYLQIVKGTSPTNSGLTLVPLMAGLLVTSVVGGRLISRYGRYKVFPIVGTAIMTGALYLLSRLTVETPIWKTIVAMIVLGLGLGMVMQVLVLAAQNAVDHRLLGVATSGSTLFRQIGAAIGVAAFGAIFANRLGSEFASRLPGAKVPDASDPQAVEHLPAAIHAPYVDAIAAALHPVFLSAMALTFLAFLLSWLLRELPLRTTTTTS
jgi:predicted MFS family arabinose efflux permease